MQSFCEVGLLKINGGRAVSKKDKELTGKQKAALLLISLGPEVSASVYKHLNEEEIERLTLEISSVKKLNQVLKKK